MDSGEVTITRLAVNVGLIRRTGMVMSSATAGICTITATGTTTDMRDTRIRR